MKIISAIGEAGLEEAVIMPANSVILWNGSSAPSGWSIYAQSLFIKGASAGNISTTPAGSESHTHTMPSSTGSRGDHTHNASFNNSGTASHPYEFYGHPENADTAPGGHTHSGGNMNTSSDGGHSHTVGGSTGSTPHMPPYTVMNWITNSSPSLLPVGAILFHNSLSSPNSSFVVSSILGHQKFVYGGDPGQSGPQGSTHKHSTNSNTGSAGEHNHYAGSFTYGWSGGNKNASTYGASIAAPHNHSAGGSTGTDSNHNHSLGDTHESSNIPPYIDLACVEYVEETDEVPSGIIIAFKGSSSAIPSGWSLYTSAANRFVRVITSGTVGATGGSATHTHSNPNTGSRSSHNHTGPSGTMSGAPGVKITDLTGGSGAWGNTTGHSHTWSVGIGTADSHGHSVGATGSANHEPPHIRLYFIQKS